VERRDRPGTVLGPGREPEKGTETKADDRPLESKIAEEAEPVEPVEAVTPVESAPATESAATVESAPATVAPPSPPQANAGIAVRAWAARTRIKLLTAMSSLTSGTREVGLASRSRHGLRGISSVSHASPSVARAVPTAGATVGRPGAPNGVLLFVQDINEGIALEKDGLKITAFEVDHSPVWPAFG
jgi:hypothetical protein